MMAFEMRGHGYGSESERKVAKQSDRVARQPFQRQNRTHSPNEIKGNLHHDFPLLDIVKDQPAPWRLCRCSSV